MILAMGRVMLQSVHMEKPLHEFFSHIARQSFHELGVDDQPVVDYVAALLTEFARADRLYPIRDRDGRAIDHVADITRTPARISPNDQRSLLRARALRKYVGDYSLFMSGVFRSHVESRGALAYYFEEGQRSYWAVSELDLTRFETDFLFFQQLAKNFEHYSGALDYMRKSYFTPEPGRGPFAEFLRQVEGWISGGLSQN